MSFYPEGERKKSSLELEIAYAVGRAFSQKKVVSWQEFLDLEKVECSFGNVFLKIGSSPQEVRVFLEEFVKARMSEEEGLFNRFLEEADKKPDNFYQQPVSSPPPESLSSVIVPNVSQVLKVLNLLILKIGVSFSFNGTDESSLKLD